MLAIEFQDAVELVYFASENECKRPPSHGVRAVLNLKHPHVLTSSL